MKTIPTPETVRKMLVTAAVALLGVSTSTQAEQITFVATGAVSMISGDVSQPLPKQVDVGDALEFTYVFESTTTGNDLGDGFVEYPGALIQVSVSVSGNNFTFGPCASCNQKISVQNDRHPDSYFVDEYAVLAYNSSGTPYTFVHLVLSGKDPDEFVTALTSTDLPVNPPSPAAFVLADVNETTFYLVFNGPTGPGEVQAKVTSLTKAVAKTPQELLTELAQAVVAMNVQAGISNALDSKLDNALNALDSAKKGDKYTAINMLNAFISSVLAQRGKALSDAQATQLVNGANAIILAIGP